MKTIGAKDLRKNLGEVLDRVNNGEAIILKHRFKKPVLLSAFNSMDSTNSEKLAGLKAFENAPKRRAYFDPNKPTKELYHEAITDKYAST